ncbi:MAG: glucosyl-3-phosphoglycerate synthase [Anaerolineales bacterium]|nr:glucosyl-3-phosphoglycerate synthase [Anaerolineales bacterium]
MRTYKMSPFRKLLVPLFPGLDGGDVLHVGRALARDGQVVLVGLVGIPEEESLSTAAPLAKQMREAIRAETGVPGTHVRERVRVSHQPLLELKAVIEEEKPDLLLLSWPDSFQALLASPEQVFSTLHCSLAMVRGPLPACIRSILLPMRGSAYAEQALRISLALAETCQATLTSLHMTPPESDFAIEPSFRGLSRVLDNLPEIEQRTIKADDFAAEIVARACDCDLVVMGLTRPFPAQAASLGAITSLVLNDCATAVIAVRSDRPVHEDLYTEQSGSAAISVLVDKWFAETTYYADEFADLEYLQSLKQKMGVTVSLALPALNEEATVGRVIETIKGSLMDSVALLDEIVLMDSSSSDRTRAIAADLGVPVHIHQETLPQYGVRQGKGEALWKSLYVTSGDIVLWIDTDIVNIHPRFVYGLLGPLLLREKTLFVKGFYRRPLRVGDKIQAGGGGRVTELVARPLLNMFYPELSGLVQPLSGEYGGRRSALERLPFASDYGVEIGLLIDLFEEYGLHSIAQVDLQKRVHHNQPLTALSKMSFVIIQTVARKLEQRYGWKMLDEVNQSMKLVRYEEGRFHLDVEELGSRERPPMITIPEYLERPRR